MSGWLGIGVAAAVIAALFALRDIRLELLAIRRILEKRDGRA